MTNREAVAYAVLAARDVGVLQAQAAQLTEVMRWRMDVMTESEAVRAADRWLASSDDDP